MEEYKIAGDRHFPADLDWAGVDGRYRSTYV